MIANAVMPDMTQPAPRNVGRRNAHNTNPMTLAMRRRTTFNAFLMRLRLEKDALPRLTDMLLFVFIVRHFF